MPRSSIKSERSRKSGIDTGSLLPVIKEEDASGCLSVGVLIAGAPRPFLQVLQATEARPVARDPERRSIHQRASFIIASVRVFTVLALKRDHRDIDCLLSLI